MVIDPAEQRWVIGIVPRHHRYPVGLTIDNSRAVPVLPRCSMTAATTLWSSAVARNAVHDGALSDIESRYHWSASTSHGAICRRACRALPFGAHVFQCHDLGRHRFPSFVAAAVITQLTHRHRSRESLRPM
jgi:hypothetical protein